MTTIDDSPKKVLEIHRSRDVVELEFRTTRETIKICPIWNRTWQYIKAHLFICFLECLLNSLVELEARKQIFGTTCVKALDRLKRFTKNVLKTAFLPIHVLKMS